jgi:hypothetical protein
MRHESTPSARSAASEHGSLGVFLLLLFWRFRFVG